MKKEILFAALKLPFRTLNFRIPVKALIILITTNYVLINVYALLKVLIKKVGKNG